MKMCSWHNFIITITTIITITVTDHGSSCCHRDSGTTIITTTMITASTAAIIEGGRPAKTGPFGSCFFVD